MSPEIKFTSLVEPGAIVAPEPEPQPPVNGQNLVPNSEFDDDSGWTVINHYEAENTMGDVIIANGVATFIETETAEEGAWKHMGIYTQLTLEQGSYQFDMDIQYDDIADLWGEVYIGSSVPVPGTEYNGDEQILKVFNSWECADVKTFTGRATQTGCDSSATPGQFSLGQGGTYYLLVRSGGAFYGADGIVIDNLSVVKLD